MHNRAIDVPNGAKFTFIGTFCPIVYSRCTIVHSATAADVTIDSVTYDVVYSVGEPSYAAIKYGRSYTGSELTIPATIICYE